MGVGYVVVFGGLVDDEEGEVMICCGWNGDGLCGVVCSREAWP